MGPEGHRGTRVLRVPIVLRDTKDTLKPVCFSFLGRIILAFYLLEEPLWPPPLLPPEEPPLLRLCPPDEPEPTPLLLPPPEERELTLLLPLPPDEREETLLLLCPPDDRELMLPEDFPVDRDADFNEPDPEEFPEEDDRFEEDEMRSRDADGLSPLEMVVWDDLVPEL